MEGTPTHTVRHARLARTEGWLHDDSDSTGETSRSTAAGAQELTAKPSREALAYISQDESQAMIQPLILEVSVKISCRIALLEAPSVDPAQGSDDIAALAWIQRCLEDVEATLIGLSEVNRRRSAAFQSAAPSSAGNLVP